MVTNNHYRWDFIGLSTDTKPIPSTSEKVVNGSTYYCSDTSQLYVWYKDQWYEKTVSGGASYTAGDGIDITDGTISATNTGKAKVLTSADYNYPTDNPTSIAPWLLDAGLYANPSKLMVRTNSGADNGTLALFVTNIGTTSKQIVYVKETDIFLATFTNEGTSLGFRRYLRERDITDSLTSTSTTSALSANQGKVLKDLIDGISGFTTLDLSSGDKNIWELDHGTYKVVNTGNAAATICYRSLTGITVLAGAEYFLFVYGSTSNTKAYYLLSNQTLHGDNHAIAASGLAAQVGGTRNWLPDRVINNLTASSSDAEAALSAHQGKVLNDKIVAAASYTTTEVDTGGTWVDGSTIYKITVPITALPNNTTTNISHGITNLSKVIKFEGTYADSSNDTLPLNLPAHSSDSDSYVRTSVSNTYITIRCGADRSSYSGYVTIYYTKTS